MKKRHPRRWYASDVGPARTGRQNKQRREGNDWRQKAVQSGENVAEQMEGGEYSNPGKTELCRWKEGNTQTRETWNGYEIHNRETREVAMKFKPGEQEKWL